ncbi:glycosyltransferase family 2 protein [Sediminicola luteus]|uniref:glycosyltransferase family 2 protein n=1 Tax=Sediminicola luteus TaxID=319238 RepID=UPI001FE49AA0|nr:glycosyltransferase family 2 protein [Sediminicola luteus]
MELTKDFLFGLQFFGALYAVCYLISYVSLGVFSVRALRIYNKKKPFAYNEILKKSEHTLGVSIIAPVYNESETAIYSIKSLLAQEYAKFEVIIVNDGSTDNTLELISTVFQLEQIPYYKPSQIPTQKIKGCYRSKNPAYSRLMVLDKVNGGSKADASNAGINASNYPIFICTDGDSILRKDSIAQLIRPFIEEKTRVIATGAMIRISNACVFTDGALTQSNFPSNFLARFQELEYIRSFLFGRMALGHINSLLLVSGGLGMFDKEIVIKAGGYWHKSLGEDLELVTRMRIFMHEQKEEFLVDYIPETLCWTEVPSNLNIFIRQRARWGRGLVQTLFQHRNTLGSPMYGRTGLLAVPYFFFLSSVSLY